VSGQRTDSNAEAAILQATERLLEDVPLHDLSVAQIIRAADTSRATFYFYFSSKFAVVAALVRQAIGEIYEASRPFIERQNGMPEEEALRRRIEAAATVWQAHRPVLRATVENWQVFPELRTLWLELIAGLTDGIAAEIDHARAAGLSPLGADARQLAATLAWTTERCLYVAGLGLGDAAADERQIVAALTQLWMAVMYGRAPVPGGESAAPAARAAS
jgi:TetR/AcrR family transcriptional regulator, ethionamide resistance regulator